MPYCCQKTNLPATLLFHCALLIAMLMTVSCQQTPKKYSVNLSVNQAIKDSICPENEKVTPIELSMISHGLIDIESIGPMILLDIKYSGTDNFLKTDIYGDYNKAFVQPEVAAKLLKAQNLLNKLRPGYRLLIFDAARPVKCQQMLWDALKMPSREKGKYASNPARGSLHNFGAAVDLSIVDEKGKELDMGCCFDYLGPLAYPSLENKLLAEGKLTTTQVSNRKLLRSVMHQAGFFNIQTEWWHFNSCTRAEAMGKYERIE